jgi:GNAT superfamily N-acetyltransferase
MSNLTIFDKCRDKKIAVDYQIRPLGACPEYAVQLARWHHSQTPKECLQERIDLLETHIQSLDFPTTLVADNNKELMGSVSLAEYQELGGYRASIWLTSMYVKSTRREQGIGSALLLAAERYAQSHGCKTLLLYTHDKDVFYGNRGWQRVSSHVFSGTTKTIMTCLLDER